MTSVTRDGLDGTHHRWRGSSTDGPRHSHAQGPVCRSVESVQREGYLAAANGLGIRTGWPDFPQHSGQPANPCRSSCRHGSYSSTGMVRRHGVSIAVLCRIICAAKNKRCSSRRDASIKSCRSWSVAARLAARLTPRIARKCKIPRRYGGFRSRPRGTRTRNLRIKSPQLCQLS